VRGGALGLLLLASCGPKPGLPEERLAGGATTVFDVSENAFGFPAANLAAGRTDAFFAGNSLFRANWVIAPASPEARDGLGPLYNAVSCSSCHFKDGRGRPPVGLLFRISRPGGEPDPAYGDQIQPLAIPGVPPEAEPGVDYVEVPGRYADGSAYSLRRPAYRLDRPGYGPLPKDLLVSPRLAPAVVGMGLLEAIPEAAILARADEADADRDGISGRPNRVRDARSGRTALGRFGWKANQPTVEQQIAGAFLGDMGITSPLFPEENHTAAQKECAGRPSGGTPEIDAEKLGFVTFYVKTLAVPGRRAPGDARVLRGKKHFEAACATCHTPRHVTGEAAGFPELSRQGIYAYTDLLLHDMGPDLADGRPDGLADGREWRTPPLWGIGLAERVGGSAVYLHDGRARDLAEAILWHGGEGEAAREYFRTLSAEDREALIAFLKDL
jgi:CxxC motif-containing protein (DUF1111 family)